MTNVIWCNRSVIGIVTRLFVVDVDTANFYQFSHGPWVTQTPINTINAPRTDGYVTTWKIDSPTTKLIPTSTLTRWQQSVTSRHRQLSVFDYTDNRRICTQPETRRPVTTSSTDRATLLHRWHVTTWPDTKKAPRQHHVTSQITANTVTTPTTYW